MERETGIEPATNSLEGCDSTTELLPPTRPRSPRYRPTKPSLKPPKNPDVPGNPGSQRSQSPAARDSPFVHSLARCKAPRQKHSGGEALPTELRQTSSRSLQTRAPRAKFGGEGRVRTSVARWAADLQSAAIDHSATSPILLGHFTDATSGTRPLDPPAPEATLNCVLKTLMCARVTPKKA